MAGLNLYPLEVDDDPDASDALSFSALNNLTSVSCAQSRLMMESLLDRLACEETDDELDDKVWSSRESDSSDSSSEPDPAASSGLEGPSLDGLGYKCIFMYTYDLCHRRLVDIACTATFSISVYM